MKVLDLFSGIGSFSVGLERAGFETVAFCEIDEFCRSELCRQWPEVKIYDDIKDLTAGILETDGIRCDVIAGGFPCQDLSAAGRRKGITAARSGLYTQMLRLVGDCRPRFTIFENVTALLRGDAGRWFAQFLYDLASVGYDAEWHCISASEFGAAHHRDRVWIIAYPNGTNVEGLDFPQPLFPHTEESRRRQYSRAVDAALPANDYIRMRENFNGLSEEMNTLKAYGNSVYPLIPEFIGKAILKAEL